MLKNCLRAFAIIYNARYLFWFYRHIVLSKNRAIITFADRKRTSGIISPSKISVVVKTPVISCIDSALPYPKNRISTAVFIFSSLGLWDLVCNAQSQSPIFTNSLFKPTGISKSFDLLILHRNNRALLKGVSNSCMTYYTPSPYPDSDAGQHTKEKHYAGHITRIMRRDAA